MFSEDLLYLIDSSQQLSPSFPGRKQAQGLSHFPTDSACSWWRQDSSPVLVTAPPGAERVPWGWWEGGWWWHSWQGSCPPLRSTALRFSGKCCPDSGLNPSGYNGSSAVTWVTEKWVTHTGRLEGLLSLWVNKGVWRLWGQGAHIFPLWACQIHHENEAPAKRVPSLAVERVQPIAAGGG